MMEKKRIKNTFFKKTSGQSVVEFTLTLIFSLGIIFFFLKLILVFSFSNYVHYATFMAARAFLSSGENDQDQLERAKRVLAALVKQGPHRTGIDKYPMIARGVGFNHPFKGAFIGKMKYVWQEGVAYRFETKLFFPLARLKANKLTLTSESWLGRDPTYQECLSYMEDLLDGRGVFLDNGC